MGIPHLKKKKKKGFDQHGLDDLLLEHLSFGRASRQLTKTKQFYSGFPKTILPWISCNIEASEKVIVGRKEYWTKTDSVFKYSRYWVTRPLVTGNIQLPDF